MNHGDYGLLPDKRKRETYLKGTSHGNDVQGIHACNP